METNYAVAPGEYVEEWMEDNNVSLSHMSSLLGQEEEQTQFLLRGEVELTDENAERLEEVTGIKKKMWKSCENLYRSDLERLGLTR